MMFRRFGIPLLKAVLATALTISLTALAALGLEYRRSAKEYAQAEALAGLSSPPPAVDPAPSAGSGNGEVKQGPTLPGTEQEAPEAEAAPSDGPRDPEEPDLAALREVNPDVAFWLLIPDTAVSYPVVQGADNSFYLNHTWTLRRSRVGAIFLDCRCSAPLSGFNTLIYGHHMRDGSMFAALAGYAQQDFWAAHPTVYLLTPSGRIRCEVFAAYETEVTGSAYRLDFPGEADRLAFLEACLSRSVIDTGITPTARDRVLTLSTCTAAGGRQTRWVVQGVLYEEDQYVSRSGSTDQRKRGAAHRRDRPGGAPAVYLPAPVSERERRAWRAEPGGPERPEQGAEAGAH